MHSLARLRWKVFLGVGANDPDEALDVDPVPRTERGQFGLGSGNEVKEAVVDCDVEIWRVGVAGPKPVPCAASSTGAAASSWAFAASL